MGTITAMTRREAIQSLVQFDRPLQALRATLGSFPFDWDGAPLATLTRDQVLAVLNRWQAGQLTTEQVEDWANLVEVRDDLSHDPSDPAVAEAVFDLANPVLQGRLDEIGSTLLARLSA